MTAVAETTLSLEEFHLRYDGEKPYFEYWDGEPIQKSMPTRLHALIQEILLYWLRSLGYDAGCEITLKLVPNYEPVPDVIAAEGKLGDPYPTEAFEIAIEILSPADPFSRVLRKCALYAQWGIRQIVVIDPVSRQVWTYLNGALTETGIVVRRGESAMLASDLWAAVDRYRSSPSTPPASAKP